MTKGLLLEQRARSLFPAQTQWLTTVSNSQSKMYLTLILASVGTGRTHGAETYTKVSHSEKNNKACI